MRIGILGAGNVGGALARVWTGKGHEVVFGVPDARSERTQKTIAALGRAARAPAALVFESQGCGGVLRRLAVATCKASHSAARLLGLPIR